MSVSVREKPILSYSSYPTLYGGIAFLILFVFSAFYSGYVWSNPIPLFVFVTLWGAGTYWLWVKPLRSIKFYGNVLEIIGWKVNLKASYLKVENLSRVKRTLGDFRSNGVLWFSVEGCPSTFSMPNRMFGKPKTELYAWLLQKNPRSSSAS